MVVKAIERTKGAVVNIYSERVGSSSRPVQGMGTGIVIDSRGWIVTNHHVIEEVASLKCHLEKGTAHIAKVVAKDAALDLAIIKIDVAETLPMMPLGTATDLMLGETVIAVGNAHGYEHTVSVGVISALKRDIGFGLHMSYKALIQTDAALNPGNSGGPLINVHGEMIGINVAVRDRAQNIGFAIPVEQVIRSSKDMLRSKRKTFDGFIVQDRLKDGPDGPVRSVVVENVDSNSPASKAGMKTGDQILRVGELAVLTSFDVERALLDRKAGDQVVVEVRRESKALQLALSLSGTEEKIWSQLGLRLIPAAKGKLAGHKQLLGGLEVTEVNKESLAGRSGIRKGDILIRLHDWSTYSLDHVAIVLAHPERKTFTPLTYYVIRNGEVRKGNLQETPE